MMKPDEIRVWSAEFREGSEGKFQINLWIPEAPPIRDFESEKRQREFLALWGPPVPTDAGDATLPNFEAQCQAMIAAAPTVVSSIMGLYPPDFVSEMKAHGILWFATVALGAAFLYGTGAEWHRLIYQEGLTITTNLFGTTYYSLVGLHAFHVVVGLLTLTIVMVFTMTRGVRSEHAERIDVLSLYWHFVDVVWIVVFTVVYVIGR